MLRTFFVIVIILIPIFSISAQIKGLNVVEFNSNAIYTETHVGTPGVSAYYWKVIGGTKLDGETETQVEVNWNQLESGRVEKWINTYMNEEEILIYEFQVTIQNTPTIEYSYDNAGNRISRQFIYLNSNQLKKSTQRDGLIEEKEVIEDRIGKLTISIFPNPTAGILTITASGLDENSSSSIAIYSTNGAKIKQVSPIENTNTINLSGEPEGLYILIFTKDNETSKWKIIKR